MRIDLLSKKAAPHGHRVGTDQRKHTNNRSWHKFNHKPWRTGSGTLLSWIMAFVSGAGCGSCRPKRAAPLDHGGCVRLPREPRRRRADQIGVDLCRDRSLQQADRDYDSIFVALAEQNSLHPR